MPTTEKPLVIVVNGKVEEPINKRKLPPKVDWQQRIRERVTPTPILEKAALEEEKPL